MDKDNLNLIVEQIRCIALGKEIPEGLKIKSSEFAEVQAGLEYLSDTFFESNQFLRCLTEGVLEVEPPKNPSAISYTLKDLQSKLRHVTWQTKQVANGCYSQKVSFLGEFTEAFNEMVSQLSQREEMLKQHSVILSQSIDLLQSIMDALEDSVIVISVESRDIIYKNESARKNFFDKENCIHKCNSKCNFLKSLKNNFVTNYEASKKSMFYEYYCEISKTSLYATIFTIYWNDQLSYVHYIKDVTNEKEFKLQMEKMVYKDQLTNLYNRRFCIEKIQGLLSRKEKFVCCLIDLDGLKFANDNFGHKVGDDYLKLVASQLREVFEENAFICRFGGDEFVVISTILSHDQVINCVKRTDKALIKKSDRYLMSISYGAIYISGEDNFSYKQVIHNADEEMYVFKKSRKKEREC